MTPRATLLVVEDDPEMRRLLREGLAGSGFCVVVAREGSEALETVRSAPVDVVITDLVMPGMPGRELLEEVRRLAPDIPVIITTAFGTIESAVDSIKAGAFQYVRKPFGLNDLLTTIGSALRERERRRDVLALQEVHGESAHGIVAESAAMRQALGTVLRAASADSPVLLLGESGTGKELLARVLHAEGPRRQRRFVAVNCAAIPETLLESQLFGHRRGSFTDAREDRRGLFQEADGGTILLDEIGDMPQSLQGKLLRVLQEREVLPVGATAPVRVDVRVVAATHRDLESRVEAGEFRGDLYYRLDVIAVRVAPLRERPEDLLPLIAHFLEKHGRRLARGRCTLSAEALAALRSHSWPGNTRELENVIERALVLGRDDLIGIDDLPEPLRARSAGRANPHAIESLAEAERSHVLKALRAARGNKAAAARLLGLDRKTLYRKLAVYDSDGERVHAGVADRPIRPGMPRFKSTS